MSTNVAEHVVDLTLASGIRPLYGMVGDSADAVIDAIRRAAAELTLVPIRNGEAGAFARRMFAGDTAEVVETIKSPNGRNISQAT